MLTLYIANKNYSSWSLRPWVLMTELGIAFKEELVPFQAQASANVFKRFSPSGKVPCLVDSGMTIWDSLAITEYLAEMHACVWPAQKSARAWARSAAAEMHSGFTALRSTCSMTCGLRVRLHTLPDALKRDLDRLTELWNDGLRLHGGPFLAGERFTAVDAFFAPVAFRVQTYGLELDAFAAAYVQRLLDLRSMRRWYEEALGEPWRDRPHDEETLRVGQILEDLRAPEQR